MTEKTAKRVLIKIADPERGISREEYEALCAKLGWEPDYGDSADASANNPKANPGSAPDSL